MGLKVFNIDCCISYLYSKMASFVIRSIFKIVPLKSQSLDLHPHKHEIDLSPKCSWKAQSSFLFLDELAYIISEEKFYIYREGELPFPTPYSQEAERDGGQSRTQPMVYGMGRDAEMRVLDPGTVRDHDAGPSAGSISPSMPLICSSKHDVLPTAAISSSAKSFYEKLAAFSPLPGPLATAGLLRLCPFFRSPWSLAQLLWHSLSVSLNSACTLSLLSVEIRVLAHALEQLQPSVKGGAALARGAAAPRDSQQQASPCRFPHRWVCIKVQFTLSSSIRVCLQLRDADCT